MFLSVNEPPISNNSTIIHYNKFSWLFKAQCENLSSIDNALTPIGQKLIRAKKSIDCIVIQLGINDLRNSSVNVVIHKMRQLLDDLLSTHRIPIVVCKLLPCLDASLNNKIKEFNAELEHTISITGRNSSVSLNKGGRFWELNNSTLKEFFKADDPSGIHINRRGVSVFSNSIKYSLASVFNVRIHRQRTEQPRENGF